MPYERQAAPANDCSEPVSAAGSDKRLAGRAEAATEMNAEQGLANLRFECSKNAFYHEDREHFFAVSHKLVMFIVAMSGTAAFAALSNPAAFGDPRWVAFTITAASLLDLVLDLSGRAREHASLRRRFLDLLAEVEAGGIELSKANGVLYRLYAEEPVSYRIVNSLAYNSAARAFGHEEKTLLKVSLARRISRHFFPSPGFDPKTIGESNS